MPASHRTSTPERWRRIAATPSGLPPGDDATAASYAFLICAFNFVGLEWRQTVARVRMDVAGQGRLGLQGRITTGAAVVARTTAATM